MNVNISILTEEQLNELLNLVAKNAAKMALEEFKSLQEPFAKYPEFLTRKQASEIADCSVKTIDRRMKEGVLTLYETKFGMRYKKSDIIKVIKH